MDLLIPTLLISIASLWGRKTYRTWKQKRALRAVERAQYRRLLNRYDRITQNRKRFPKDSL